MINKQKERLRSLAAEELGIDVDQVLLAYAGPSYMGWLVAAVAVGIVVFVVIGLGGLLGGALVGAAAGSYFLFADPFLIVRGTGETALIRMDQPALAGSMKVEEVVSRDPLGRVPIELSKRTVTYGERRFEVLPFWGGAAEELEQAGG